MRRSLIIVTALVVTVLSAIPQFSVARTVMDQSAPLPPITDGVTPLVPKEQAEWNRYKAKALKENPGADKEAPVMGTPKLDVLARQALRKAYQNRYGVPSPGCMTTRWMLYKVR